MSTSGSRDPNQSGVNFSNNVLGNLIQRAVGEGLFGNVNLTPPMTSVSQDAPFQFAQLPDPRFGTRGPTIGNPSVQPTLIQNQMFQPVQNPMPGSFLDQLQQSTQVLNNQIRNVVPQNRFIGNQFQMPFNFSGSSYSPGNFNYTPQPFNQYGNMFGFNLPGFNFPGFNQSGIGGPTSIQDREGYQGERGGFSENQARDSYRVNADGSISQFDSSEGKINRYNLTDEKLTLAQRLFGALTKIPTTGSLIESLVEGARGLLGGGVDPTDPETYGYTGPVKPTGFLGALSNIGKEGLQGKGTKETTEAAAKSAAETEKEITEATEDAAESFSQGGGNNNSGPGAGGTVGRTDGVGAACFEPNTLIQMDDGSEKKIKDVQLGDLTKGGKVTGVLQFEPIDDIHNYNGVVVAGSHYVKENDEFILVQDSPDAVKIDKIPVVYSLDTSNRRIFINDIEFADYNGDGIAKNFLNNAGIDLSGFDKEVLRQVEHRLI